MDGNTQSDIEIKKYCKDINEWPKSWERIPEDVEYGREILVELKEFINFIISKGYKPKTIKKHIDNLWLLGGELIDKLDRDSSLREIPAKEFLFQNIGPDGGPYSKHLHSEYEFESFDATCRKLYKFLNEKRKNSIKTNR